MSVFFNGHMLITPQTASAVDDSAMVNQNSPVGNVVAIVGTSQGGKPKTGLAFSSPTDAKLALVSGSLLDAVLAAFNPSNETNGPSQVIAVRANPAVQATGVMSDIGGNPVINLTSKDYGALQNQVCWKIENGSLAGLRVTVKFNQAIYTQDNVTRNAFSIHYTGTGASANISITNTSVTLNVAGSAVATLDLTQFTTIQQLVDRINLVSGFVVQVLDNNYSKPALNGLDNVSSVDVKTSTVTMKADLQAVVDWLNGPSQGLVSAARVTAGGAAPAVAPFTFLSGASDGATTNQDWADCFGVLQTIDAQWISAASPSAAIMAMVDAHVQYMSTVGRKERRAIVGMDTNTPDQNAMAQAKALNSDRTSLVHIGHYAYDASGSLTLYPAYITAAMIAGAFAGVSPGTPLTNKSLNVSGLERNLRNPTDTDVLLTNGVLCLENTSKGYKVVQSISTWLNNANYNRREQSCGAALDYCIRSVREVLDVLRGGKNGPLALSRAISITESELAKMAVPEPQGPGVLAGDKNSPAYRNVTATVSGDSIAVSYECSPVIPDNYITVTVFAVPYSGTASATVGG